MIKVSLVVLVMLIFAAPPTQASDETLPQSRVSLFYLYQNWNEKDNATENKINEGVFGLQLRQIFDRQWSLALRGTYTAADYYDNGASPTEDVNFSAVNDAQVEVSYLLRGRIARATLLLNLPTGKKELSDDEYKIALGIADNSRKFAVRRFGQGLDIGGDFVFLPRIGPVHFQIGGGYLYHGGYQIRKSTPADYKFGNEITAVAGLETQTDPVSFAGTVTYKLYGKDLYNDQPRYQAGNAAIIAGRLSYLKRIGGWLGFSLLSRAPAKLPDGDGENMTEELFNSGRDEILVYAGGSYPLNNLLRVLGRVEYKSVSANEYEPSSTFYRPQANYLGLGAGGQYQIAPGLSGSAAVTLYTGSVDDDHDLTGLGLALALSYRY